MGSDNFLTPIDEPNIWKQGDQRAPHMPLLVQSPLPDKMNSLEVHLYLGNLSGRIGVAKTRDSFSASQRTSRS
jgi:hypothetical protein